SQRGLGRCEEDFEVPRWAAEVQANLSADERVVLCIFSSGIDARTAAELGFFRTPEQYEDALGKARRSSRGDTAQIALNTKA
ncbi:MAG: hypothetical protein ACREMY_11060, partial [bacterium]